MSRNGIDKTSQAYIEGSQAEAARIRVRNAVRAALDAHPNVADLANEVAKHLGRDHARKQRIVQRSPHIFAAMDAEELGQASARELATRELQELGIEVGDADPVQLLDAHHAGRQFARGVTPMSGGPIMGGRPANIFNPAGMDAGDDFVSRYINST